MRAAGRRREEKAWEAAVAAESGLRVWYEVKPAADWLERHILRAIDSASEVDRVPFRTSPWRPPRVVADFGGSELFREVSKVLGSPRRDLSGLDARRPAHVRAFRNAIISEVREAVERCRTCRFFARAACRPRPRTASTLHGTRGFAGIAGFKVSAPCGDERSVYD